MRPIKTKTSMNPPPATPARITLPRDHPDVQAAARAGYDLDLIEDNLNRTPEQRIHRHNRAIALMWRLKRQYEQTQQHGTDTTI
jgi:hypothetical protein